jgi:hypothetical protein
MNDGVEALKRKVDELEREHAMILTLFQALESRLKSSTLTLATNEPSKLLTDELSKVRSLVE